MSIPSQPARADAKTATAAATFFTESPSGRYFQSVQLCRAIAAWMVFLFHVGIILAKPKYFGEESLAQAFTFGRAGVEFFFVLSGFIIFHAHADDLGRPRQWLRYAARRVLRIYPLYWLVFLATIGISLFALPESNLSSAPMGAFMSSLFLLPMDPVMVQARGAPVVPVAWTLHYELMFYAAFGLAIAWKRAGQALVLLFVLGWGLTLALGNRPFPLNFFLADYFWLFLMGCSVAALVRRVRVSAAVARLLTFVGGALLLLLATSLGTKQYIDLTFMVLLLGAASALLLFGLTQWELNQPGFAIPSGLRRMGDASYALYLIHFPIITLCCKGAAAAGILAWGGSAMLMVAVLSAIFSAGLAQVLHRFIERPLQSLARFAPQGR